MHVGPGCCSLVYKALPKQGACRAGSMLPLKQCDKTIQQSLALHQWTRQQSPTSVAMGQLLTKLLATDVGDCCLVHWCRARDCCVVLSHCFNGSIDPYMHLVSVLCKPVSSIPTCILFLCFVYQWPASLHHFLFLKVFILVSILFYDVQCTVFSMHDE